MNYLLPLLSVIFGYLISLIIKPKNKTNLKVKKPSSFLSNERSRGRVQHLLFNHFCDCICQNSDFISNQKVKKQIDKPKLNVVQDNSNSEFYPTAHTLTLLPPVCLSCL